MLIYHDDLPIRNGDFRYVKITRWYNDLPSGNNVALEKPPFSSVIFPTRILHFCRGFPAGYVYKNVCC